MIWACSMQAGNSVSQGKFGYEDRWPHQHGRDRPKRMWMEVVKIDLKKCNLCEGLDQNQNGET